MKPIKIVADDKIPFLRGVLDRYAEVIYLPGSEISRHDLLDAKALLTRTRTICNQELLSGTAVKFIATATIGNDHIDHNYCATAGIRWASAPGCNSGSVQQYVVSALVNLAAQKHFSLAKKTLGVVGVGNVGGKVAKAARALGMKVLLCDPPRQDRGDADDFVGLKKIQQQADIITLHVPLNKDGQYRTRHLADRTFFASCRDNVIFINSSRGETCDGNALKNMIKSGHVSAAVLDVWENEPDIDRELLTLATFATPHIAGYSADGKANGTSMSVRAVSRFFGLGLDNWQVSQVPEPLEPMIILPENETPEDALLQAVNHAYDIREDSRRLHENPEQFERLRGDYPLRREFPAFTIYGSSAPVFAGLGFNIEKKQ